MREYLLSIHYPPDGQPPTPDELDRIMTDLGRLHAELREAGSFVFANGLHDPSTATVVRIEDDAVVMTDGPFTEAKEVLGGVLVIRADSPDEALVWAEKASRATTTPIDVRPFQEEPAG